jgi:hypothetical protein
MSANEKAEVKANILEPEYPAEMKAEMIQILENRLKEAEELEQNQARNTRRTNGENVCDTITANVISIT